jgi:hypothetical protein
LAVSYSPEYRDLEPNTFLLSQLQGSSLAPEGVTLAGLFTQGRKPQRRLEDAWELFTLIALLLWLFDVAARRLVMSWGEWQVAFATVFYGAGFKRAVRAQESLAGLLTAKSRAFQRGAPGANALTAARREELTQEAIARQQAGGSGPAAQPASPPGEISADPAAQKPQQGSPGLSDLRKRMATKDDAHPARMPGIPPSAITGAQPSPPAAQKPEAPRRGGEHPPPADLGAREFTSKLLEKKRQRGGRE